MIEIECGGKAEAEVRLDKFYKRGFAVSRLTVDSPSLQGTAGAEAGLAACQSLANIACR